MSTPEPPEWLSPIGRVVFVNAFEACTKAGRWDPAYASMLSVLAAAAGDYVQLVREIAELPQEKITADLRAAPAAHRLVTRELMVEFLLLDPSEVAGGTSRADGLDSDIAALCDFPAVQ